MSDIDESSNFRAGGIFAEFLKKIVVTRDEIFEVEKRCVKSEWGGEEEKDKQTMCEDKICLL